MQYHASDVPQSTSNSKQQGKQQNRTGKNTSHGNIFAKHISPTRANLFVYNVDIAYLLTHIHLHILCPSYFIRVNIYQKEISVSLLARKEKPLFPDVL